MRIWHTIAHTVGPNARSRDIFKTTSTNLYMLSWKLDRVLYVTSHYYYYAH